MPANHFRCSHPGADGYPPCVRGWFWLARSGRMRRGFRDVGYLLSRRLRRFRPLGFDRRAWRFHLETLRQGLAKRDDLVAMHWFAATYPGLAGLIPADARREFLAGLRDRPLID